MKVRADAARPAWRPSSVLACATALCLALALGAGCGSAESAKPSDTKGAGAEGDLPVMKDAKAGAVKKVGRGRVKVDIESRREHQKRN